MQVMEHVHLAGEDEADDDIYEGFNEYDATLDTDALQNDPDFQRIIKTSHRPPTTAAQGLGKLGRVPIVPPSSLGRLGTGSVDGPGRPMTAMISAGFTASGKRGPAFDPMKKNTGPAPPLEQKNEDTPEERIKQLEKKVNELIEESCFASARGELQLALEKAKEAGRKERMLVRQREQISATDQINLDLTYSVLFNLANQYAVNEMFTEALNTYNVIVKNKMFSNAGRLKVNMGNIYFKQRNYSKAIKLYRMALDQIPNTHKNMRTKLMQNIGITFVKLDQYNDAITSFEHIMAEEPDFQTGFNLILCYYALGDREKMKRTFMKLLSIDLKIDDEDKYIMSNDDKQYNLIQEVIKNDALRKIEREKKAEAERCIMMAAKIIAPSIEESFSDGYDWCNDQVKLSQYLDLAHSLEIDKAIGYLRQKDFQQAVETLKSFEKKDTKVAATAATNLSFLYILENEQDNADKYAEVALAADRYNPSALVNKGNVLFNKGDFEKAREYYREALQNDSSCVEALYNLGLSNKNLKRYEDALDSFYKLHSILRNSPQVIYQIADIYDKLGDMAQSVEWFLQLVGIVPSDATILQRLGEMYDTEGDKSQAFQFHYDSYRYNPSNISVIEWLGAYYIDSQFCEKAIQFFERAAIIQPNQVKWQLMVASCHRRSGNYQQALDTYKYIHKKFPENTECLKFLVRLCTDLGLREAQDYTTKLKKAEKLIRLREERASSGTSRANSGRRRSDRPDRDTSAGSTVDSAGSGKRTSATRRPITLTDDSTEQYPSNNSRQELDASYVDPLGPAVERPKTAAPSRREKDDEFGDEELGDDLLPE